MFDIKSLPFREQTAYSLEIKKTEVGYPVSLLFWALPAGLHQPLDCEVLGAGEVMPFRCVHQVAGNGALHTAGPAEKPVETEIKKVEMRPLCCYLPVILLWFPRTIIVSP